MYNSIKTVRNNTVSLLIKPINIRNIQTRSSAATHTNTIPTQYAEPYSPTKMKKWLKTDKKFFLERISQQLPENMPPLKDEEEVTLRIFNRIHSNIKNNLYGLSKKSIIEWFNMVTLSNIKDIEIKNIIAKIQESENGKVQERLYREFHNIIFPIIEKDVRNSINNNNSSSLYEQLDQEIICQNITQKVYTAIITKGYSITRKALFTTWLQTVRNNAIIDEVRKIIRKPPTTNIDQIPQNAYKIESSNNNEDLDIIWNAIKSIVLVEYPKIEKSPNNWLSIIETVLYNPKCQQAILAEEHNMPISTFKTRLHRGRECIKELLTNLLETRSNPIENTNIALFFEQLNKFLTPGKPKKSITPSTTRINPRYTIFQETYFTFSLNSNTQFPTYNQIKDNWPSNQPSITKSEFNKFLEQYKEEYNI